MQATQAGQGVQVEEGRIEPVAQPATTGEPIKRPVGQRIKQSLRARFIGYPIIVILVVISYVVGKYGPPRDRFFLEQDPTISYPFHADTVPSWSLALIAGLGPIILIILTQFLIRKSPSRPYWDNRIKDVHLAIIVLAEVLAITYLITNILKVWVGRLRPNFFAYCDYAGYREATISGDYTNYLAATKAGMRGDYSRCRYYEPDARYSFPSGHSSISFCGLTFLTLFLTQVTSRINFRHHNIGKGIRLFVFLIPMFGAALVASSRIVDYRHFVEDTIWGALIGIIAAVIAFQANYGIERPLHPSGVPVVGGDLVRAAAPRPGAGQVPLGYSNDTMMVPTTQEHVKEITTSSPLVTRVVPRFV